MFTILNIDCATYDVPLDRTGAVPGTTKIRALKIAAPEGPRMGTLFVIAGGPGQGVEEMASLMTELFFGANRYDIVAVDQRGAGASEPLNCPRLEEGSFSLDGSNPRSDAPITLCSGSLGAARSAYNTAEAIADLETVRADLGAGPVSLFGVSYGTKVALAYAKRYPANTKALLIDSVLPVEEPSSFDTESVAALRRSLTQICDAARCRGINRSPVGGLAKLATRLAKNPVETLVMSDSRRIVPAKIDDDALFQIVLSADFNLFIYNQLPGAITSALRGDHAQLERLYAIVFGAPAVDEDEEDLRLKARPLPKPRPLPERKAGARGHGRDAFDLALFSNTMNLATNCADFSPPWTRGEDLTGRQQAIDAAADAIPAGAAYPFSRTTLRDNSLAVICRGWQQSAVAPDLPTGPLPEIPTLALNGSLDTRTPTSWAARAVAGDSKAELREIPFVGHSVVGTDLSGCALSLAKRFLIYGATDGKCHRQSPRLPVAPLPSRSLSAVTPLPGSCRGVRGKACRRARQTVTAGYLALRDALDQLVVGGMVEGPGLYGGGWMLDFDISEDLTTIDPLFMALYGLSNVRGTDVSGRFSLEDFPKADGSLRVNGYRVELAGRVAYDRRADRLTLFARNGKRRVTVRVRGRAGSAAKVTAAGVRLRVNLARATGVAKAARLRR